MDSLEDLIEGFDKDETLFIFEYHFKHSSFKLSTINHIIKEDNCEELVPLKEEAIKDNVFTRFEYDKLFDIYYYNCRT